jgi:hypothetical protein
VAGALVAGLAADAFGFKGAIWLVAAVTLFSGVVVAIRMSETLLRTFSEPDGLGLHL